ncbi:hypothetical protein JHK85_013223 [Glycine max]|nr:hypothetical protein JHK85_013223 [Glycine max]
MEGMDGCMARHALEMSWYGNSDALKVSASSDSAISYSLGNLLDSPQSSSFSTCMALFFSLLLLSHFTMAILEHNIFSPSTSNKEGVKKRNTKVVASVREESEQNSKKDMALGETSKGSIHVPKREHSQHSQSPNRIFNASAHEVPSGPNPISNR